MKWVKESIKLLEIDVMSATLTIHGFFGTKLKKETKSETCTSLSNQSHLSNLLSIYILKLATFLSV